MMILTAACTDAYQDQNQQPQPDPAREKMMQSAMLKIGGLLAKPGVVVDVTEAVRVSRDLFGNDEQVLFSDLMDLQSPIRKEMKQKSKPGQFTFASAWNDAVSGGYQTQSFDSLATFLRDQRIAFYFPYSEYFDSTAINSISLSYFDLVDEDRNEGISVPVQAAGLSTQALQIMPVDEVDDRYAQTNPTLILVPVGDGMYEYSYAMEGLDDSDGDETTPIPGNGPVRLTYNVDHKQFGDNVIVSTKVLKVRLLENTRGVFGGGNKIYLYRGTANFETDANGDIKVLPQSPNVGGEIKISRTQVRRNRFVNVNAFFDEDWEIFENTQGIYYVSKHWFTFGGVDIGIKGTLSVAKDPTSKKWIPKLDGISIPFEAKLKLGRNYKNRYQDELSRRVLLSNAFSNDPNHEEGVDYISLNGYKYVIRNVGDLQFAVDNFVTY